MKSMKSMKKPELRVATNPLTGKKMAYGCRAVANWLLRTGKVKQCSHTTVRMIALGRGESMNYSKEKIDLIKNEYPHVFN